MLRPWSEGSATWLASESGILWTQAGASADIAGIADAEGVVSWDPQWLDLDVTDAVHQMSFGQPSYGWMIVPVTGNGNNKKFTSRDDMTRIENRPKLVITYSGGGAEKLALSPRGESRRLDLDGRDATPEM